MTYLVPPHDVMDDDLYDSMVKTLENGRELSPVIALDCGNEYVAITGSHRIAAWAALEMEPEFLAIDESEYAAACYKLWPDDDPCHPQEIGDFTEFCEVLYSLTSDDDIKAALKDQV